MYGGEAVTIFFFFWEGGRSEKTSLGVGFLKLDSDSKIYVGLFLWEEEAKIPRWAWGFWPALR